MHRKQKKQKKKKTKTLELSVCVKSAQLVNRQFEEQLLGEKDEHENALQRDQASRRLRRMAQQSASRAGHRTSSTTPSRTTCSRALTLRKQQKQRILAKFPSGVTRCTKSSPNESRRITRLESFSVTEYEVSNRTGEMRNDRENNKNQNCRGCKPKNSRTRKFR